MSVRIYIPADAAAVACGADAIAEAFRVAAKKNSHDIDIVRNGSRGMHWLEPLIEVVTPKGRVGYGPARSPTSTAF